MLLLATAAALHLLPPVRTFELFSSVATSMVLASAGFAIMMFAWWQFRDREVAICPTAATDRLICDGVYRFTRNPMYLGIVFMLTGVATFYGTLPFYTAALVFFIVMDRFFCRYEEEKLLRTFGQAYAAYRSNVRRWL
jgi:protein-S-isoprenylcysteine O-methyltransferase Ste14